MTDPVPPGSDAAGRTDPRSWFGPEDRPWFHRDDRADTDAYRSAPPARRAQVEEFRRHGVVVLRSAVSPTLCAEVTEAVRPHFARTGAERLTNAGWALEPVRRLAAMPEVTETVAFLYGRRPIPFQTLNFRRGTEQAAHRDEVHFDSLPPGYMCGAWVALEPVGVDQGPVAYAPGSHRHDDGDDPGPLVPFTADVGDVLIWEASLLHGGAPVLQPGSTRWSQVTHYFFEDCIWYTPVHSDVAVGELCLRRPLLDLVTLRPQTPRLAGHRAALRRGPARTTQVVPPGSPVPAWYRRRLWRGLGSAVSISLQARWARLTGRPPAP